MTNERPGGSTTSPPDVSDGAFRLGDAFLAVVLILATRWIASQFDISFSLSEWMMLGVIGPQALAAVVRTLRKLNTVALFSSLRERAVSVKRFALDT